MTIPLARITVILIAAWIAAAALRRASADVRHRIWLASILALAILPAAFFIPRGAIPSAVLISVPVVVTGSPISAHKWNWLRLLWASGVFVVFSRMLLGIVAARRITRSSRLLEGISYSDLAATPMTWGILCPVVILPSYALDWTADRRDLVIRHERAHIARRDWLWQMAAQLVTAVYWFHPLVWLANIQLRREAEAAVDDLVLIDGAAPSDYAERLLDVARRLQRFDAPAGVIPMVRRTDLETRVSSILDPSRRRASAGLLVRCAIAIAALALILPAGVAQAPVHHVGEGVTVPRVVYKTDPQYTPEAHDKKIEGVVTLEADINTGGVAENIRVKRSLDPGLDQNAILAVSNWKFKPGTMDGEPVTVAATIEVTFRIK
jgi:TonB family protein